MTIAPGVREASFLREAPVRAEYLQAFQDWKDKLFNPIETIQPPVFRGRCNRATRPYQLQISGAFTNAVAYSNSPELTFVTTLDTSQGYFPVPQCNDTFLSTFNGTEWEWSSNPLPFSTNINRSSGSPNTFTVADYYTLRCYAKIEPAILNTGQINFSGGVAPYGVSFTVGSGGGVNFATGAFSCNNLPAGQYEIFNLKGDLYVPAFSPPPPALYGVSRCSYTLFNYRLTNLYP